MPVAKHWTSCFELPPMCVARGSGIVCISLDVCVFQNAVDCGDTLCLAAGGWLLMLGSYGGAMPCASSLSVPQQRDILMDVHGHVHEASGLGWIGKVRVLNPGSVRYGACRSVVVPIAGRVVVHTRRRCCALHVSGTVGAFPW